MEKLITKTMLCVLTLVSMNAALAQGPQMKFEQVTFDEVLKLATQTKRPVFIDAYTTWCRPCRVMESQVFTADTVAKFYNERFINSRFNMEEGEGIVLAKMFNIGAYPTLLYLNAEGKVMYRHEGSVGPEAFVEKGMNVIEKYPVLKDLESKFNAGQSDRTFLVDYINMLELFEKDASVAAERYFKGCSESDLMNDFSARLIYDYTHDMNSREFKVFFAKRVSFEEMFGIHDVNGKINSVFKQSLFALVKSNEDEKYKALQHKIRSLNFEDGEKDILYGEIYRAWERKACKELSEVTLKYMTLYTLPSKTLDDIAWLIFENSEDKLILQKAAIISRNSLLIEDDAAFNDTYASILLKLGETKRAVVFEGMAVKMASENQDSGYEGYLQKYNEMKAKMP